VMIASKRLANSVQMQAMQKELLAVVDVSSTSHPDPRLQQSLEALALSLFSLSLSLSLCSLRTVLCPAQKYFHVCATDVNVTGISLLCPDKPSSSAHTSLPDLSCIVRKDGGLDVFELQVPLPEKDEHMMGSTGSPNVTVNVAM
jgi:hypothetical protein